MHRHHRCRRLRHDGCHAVCTCIRHGVRGGGSWGNLEITRSKRHSVNFGAMFAQQRKQMLYHGVSAMALKGLEDMGNNNIGSSNSEAYSQLPTQSVRSSPTLCSYYLWVDTIAGGFRAAIHSAIVMLHVAAYCIKQRLAILLSYECINRHLFNA